MRKWVFAMSTFNSIMVQLERKPPEFENPYVVAFQFHYGSIRTSENDKLYLSGILSIPLWFN